MNPASPTPASPTSRVVTIPTPVGPARATLYSPDDAGPETRPRQAVRAQGALVLGHGAGGSGPTADLTALTGLTGQGWCVVLVDQPWRVAGRRVAGPAAQLDTAWRAVWGELLPALREEVGPGPVVAGGRSSGARVVARTAQDLRPDGLLLLSFPLTPPRRGGGFGPSRTPELDAAVAACASDRAPILVVQGSRDSFGTPAQVATVLAGESGTLPARVRVEPVPGGHSPSGSAGRIAQLVGDWLAGFTSSGGSAPGQAGE